MVYDTQGTYIAIAGLIVQVLSHYGVIVQSTDIVNIISGLVILVGVIKQLIAHRNLAVSAGIK